MWNLKFVRCGSGICAEMQFVQLLHLEYPPEIPQLCAGVAELLFHSETKKRVTAPLPASLVRIDLIWFFKRKVSTFSFQQTKAFYPAERCVTFEHAVQVRLDKIKKRTWRDNLLRRTNHTSVHQCSTDSTCNTFTITHSRQDMLCDVFSIP